MIIESRFHFPHTDLLIANICIFGFHIVIVDKRGPLFVEIKRIEGARQFHYTMENNGNNNISKGWSEWEERSR